jgi:hypothetical protein
MQPAVAPLQRFNAAKPFSRVTGGQISRSGLRGCALFFAVICAWTGERDLVIEQLETPAKIPNGVSYGDLRLDPTWDPLRGGPRFQKLCEEKQP